MELLFRYTFRRKEDGHLYQITRCDMDSIENRKNEIGSMLNDLSNGIWEIAARDLYIGMDDKDDNMIYENDIMQLVDDKGDTITFIAEYGWHARKMATSVTVDIPGFAFVLENGNATFPIIENYCNKHDLDIITIIGNLHTDPELYNPQP